MKFKIAMLSPGKMTIPSPKDSIFAPGTIIFNLTEELVRRNYEVTLFAGKESKTSAHLEHLNFNSIGYDYSSIYIENPRKYFFYETQYELMLISRAIEGANKGKFDLIHAHDFRILPYFSKFCNVPIIFTYHGSIQDDMSNRFTVTRADYYHNFCHFVAITDFQKKQAVKYFNIVSMVHNSINIQKFIFSQKPLNHVLYLGRLVEHKAPHLAIEIAKKTGVKIFVAGDKGPGFKDKIYWEKYMAPSIEQKHVKYLGHVAYQKVGEQYRRARALIFPVQWDEPFGLVMIEAMACGTPVVAFRRGSVPEIVKDGKTGFICPPDDIDCMVKKIKEIYEMPEEKYRTMRRACRKHVEENFTVEKMVDGYEKVYQKVIEDWKKKHAR